MLKQFCLVLNKKSRHPAGQTSAHTSTCTVYCLGSEVLSLAVSISCVCSTLLPLWRVLSLHSELTFSKPVLLQHCSVSKSFAALVGLCKWKFASCYNVVSYSGMFNLRSGEEKHKVSLLSFWSEEVKAMTRYLLNFMQHSGLREGQWLVTGISAPGIKPQDN